MIPVNQSDQSNSFKRYLSKINFKKYPKKLNVIPIINDPKKFLPPYKKKKKK